MTAKRTFMNILPRITAIVLMMLFAVGNLNLTRAAGPAHLVNKPRALAAALQLEGGQEHLPLTIVGLTRGQTARINVTNSPDPNSTNPPEPVTVEMCFHDGNGNIIVDRAGRLAQRTVTINPHHSESLELNGNNLAAPGSRVTIIPCLKVLNIGGGSLAIPTFEMYNNLLRTTTVLISGSLRGFDPQPDPPVPSEAAFGAVGMTQGVTARLYVLNDAPDPTRTEEPMGPITVEITFHDTEGNIFVDRTGREARKIVTIDPNHADFLDLNGNDIAAPGARVGIQPCIKVLSGSPGSRVALTLETYINFNGQTLLLANWQNPTGPIAPAPR